MSTVRLDPKNPLGSVLAWLAAWARALGLDLTQIVRVTPTRAVARAVRAQLRDWIAQLRAIVRVQALLVAAGLPAPLMASARRDARRAAGSKRPRRSGARPRAGKTSTGLPAGGHFEGMGGAAVAASPEALLDPAAQAALRRRTHAVFDALMDPSAAIIRLARRLIRRRAARPETPAFGRPPRVLGRLARALAPEPELRPPDAARVRPA